VIRKLWRLGLDVDYDIHGFFDDRKDAEREEAALVSKIGRRDLRTGPLANVTAGGEGAPSPSDAVLSARSVSLKATWAGRDKVKAMAHLNTPEVRAKTAASRSGQKRGPYKWTKSPGASTPEQRAALSVRVRANPPSRRADVRAKISASKLGRPTIGRKTRSAKQRLFAVPIRVPAPSKSMAKRSLASRMRLKASPFR
jgi:hypothetical protein